MLGLGLDPALRPERPGVGLEGSGLGLGLEDLGHGLDRRDWFYHGEVICLL